MYSVQNTMYTRGKAWEFLRISRENGQILIHENYFWIFLRNGKIAYYQDILQLPVPLNTLHNIHLNAKSHNLL